MRLSDIMSAMQLGSYAEVAMVLFMAAFLAIGVNVFRRRNADTWEHARHLPLDSELTLAPPHTSRPATSGSTRLPQE